jgi:SAM-dependent methyltransferase
MNKIWVGSASDVREGKAAEEALARQNDAKYWDDQKGIVKVDDRRWQAAQEFESDGWLRHWSTASSDRNDQHKAGFNNYEAVPQNLGKVLEIGCGPFTQLQTIMEGREIEHVTLLDPLIERYQQLQYCTYRHGRFLGRYDTQLICTQAEDLLAVEKFDTAICINVLEHVQNVETVLAKLHQSIVTGGVIIFGERYYDGLDINEIYDIGHPIRVKLKVLTEWEEQFDTLFFKAEPNQDPLAQEHYFIGRKKKTNALEFLRDW